MGNIHFELIFLFFTIGLLTEHIRLSSIVRKLNKKVDSQSEKIDNMSEDVRYLTDAKKNNVYSELQSILENQISDIGVTEQDKIFKGYMTEALAKIYMQYKEIKNNGIEVLVSEGTRDLVILGSLHKLHNFPNEFINKVKFINENSFDSFIRTFKNDRDNGVDFRYSLKTNTLRNFKNAVRKIAKEYDRYCRDISFKASSVNTPFDRIVKHEITPNLKRDLKKLLSENEVEKVFELLFLIPEIKINDLIMLSRQHSEYTHDKNINLEINQKELNRITNSILNLIDGI